MPEQIVTGENFVDQLRSAFPEMESAYQREVQLFDGQIPGPYNVAAFAFKPLLRAELERNQLTDFLERFSAFLERVCSSGDVEAKNVVWLKFLKLLLTRSEYLRLLWPLLGSSTKAEIRKAALKWGLIDRLRFMVG